jgi:hypothetical protein
MRGPKGRGERRKKLGQPAKDNSEYEPAGNGKQLYEKKAAPSRVVAPEKRRLHSEFLTLLGRAKAILN